MLSSFQLEALLAVCDAGSFERAAASLHVSPSAVSQRIASLERTVGQVLVHRSKPVVATPTGQVLLGLARRTVTLQQEALASLGRSSTDAPVVAIAVNTDSFTSWFDPVIAAVGERGGIRLDIRLADEQRSLELLTRGEVMAAVSTDSRAAPGCEVVALGRLRYLPVISPTLASRHTAPGDGSLDYLGRIPVVRYDAGDDLDTQLLASLGVSSEAPAHHVPSSQGYLTAVASGLGWGTLFEDDYRRLSDTGAGVLLHPTAYVEATLYWHRWKQRVAVLDTVTDVVRATAARRLRPLRHERESARAPRP